MKRNKIPAAAILRLSIYYRYLQRLLQNGTTVVSSAALARYANVNPAQLRKDLSYFGRFGVRGIGYDVVRLAEHIRGILGLVREWRMALVGVDCVGRALLANRHLQSQGYRFVAAFDNDPKKVGEDVGHGLKIRPMEEFEEIVNADTVDIGVIAVSVDQAQSVANAFVKAGVRGILNFAPTRLDLPGNIMVQYVDFTVLLDSLAYGICNLTKIEDEKKACILDPRRQRWNREHSWPVVQFFQ
ncbi:Redox-sensitive transcriptional regulator (AT-rich DNA-binding protein) [Dissulfuribacter thermophilus]|uniref:Redox-sensing transcriptional repressor Rex n=1 Tax=Dissulfuribacter thermophilus TaxID=1156395 RepID=A0A1B9F2Y2_9BACT|nr:redox-sensing transcriptional repressor Rex [Dissulfuribacter thermophilus]OCC14175.1 Redox-sensitive transcriptional regulator (AT-rich DNA-binding protein) [Dissulfuribacter thermophilus]